MQLVSQCDGYSAIVQGQALQDSHMASNYGAFLAASEVFVSLKYYIYVRFHSLIPMVFSVVQIGHVHRSLKSIGVLPLA